jgi:hypothetical protein
MLRVRHQIVLRARRAIDPVAALGRSSSVIVPELGGRGARDDSGKSEANEEMTAVHLRIIAYTLFMVARTSGPSRQGLCPWTPQSMRLALVLLAACGSVETERIDAGTEAVAPDVVMPEPLRMQIFTESNDDIMNPERGFVDQVDFAGKGDFAFVRKNGRTLAYAGVRLDAYKTQNLDQAILQTITSGFDRARAAGIKLVLRFVYNDGVVPVAEAAMMQMQTHMLEIGPLLNTNVDVIAVMNAGFIGYWGEWHHSGGTDVNNMDNDTAHKAVLESLLIGLPSTRMVEIRTPMAKGALYGAPITAMEGFTTAAKARVGHHNDCFLSSPDDYGTYATPMWKDYVAQETQFTPHGGETCALDPPRSDCPTSVMEMALLHTSHLNALYNQKVLDAWQTQGCLDQVKRKLGYRFSFERAVWTESVRPGGILHLILSMRNTGFASAFNPRKAYLVLEGGATTLSALLSTDPRRWAPSSSTLYEGKLRIPANLAPGTYTLALALPDDAKTLAFRPEYAIQLANSGVWNASKGTNTITTAFVVDPSAPGDADPSATVFSEIP